MKFFSLLLLAAALPFHGLSAQAAYKDELVKGAQAVMEAVNNRDVAATIALTHPRLFTLMNGKEAFEKSTRNSMAKIENLGVRYEQIKVGTPTDAVRADTDLVSFIPITSIMVTKNRRLKCQSFLVAIKSLDQPRWLYLDGSDVSQNPERTQALLPYLPKGTRFPPTSVEPL